MLHHRAFAPLALLAGLALPLAGGCEDGSTENPLGQDDGEGASSNGSGTGGGEFVPAEDPVLAARVTDYNEAFRTASLKLVRSLPTLAQIKKIQNATDPKAAYEEELDLLFEDPRFASRMLKFWRDAMRMGGGEMDTAPALAAQLMIEERPFTELFTAETGNCPTLDGATGVFTAADCGGGAPKQAGVLSNPSMMKQFYGNMAFRRVRWVQETFVCTKFPAEVVEAPTKIDEKDYTAPWAFESISDTPVNFRDTQSVVCANCHATLNHLAPLFGNYDAEGQYTAAVSVMTPQVPDPVATEISHWLPEGQKTSWRMNTEVADLGALGTAMANDQDVIDCAVARMWNLAMSKEDIVADLATVPYSVLEPYVTGFESSDYNLKETLRTMMKSEDFVKF